MASCSITGYRFYNGTNASGWSSWSSTKQNAYAGYSSTNKRRCVYAIKVKTSAVAGTLQNTSLTISIPLIKSNPGASEGNLLAKIYTEANDPTGSYANSTPSGDPYNTGYDASLYFSGITASGAVKTITISPSTFELAASTTYVVVFGFDSSSQVIQIGYSGGNFSASWDYKAIVDGTATVSIKDNDNNTYTISGKVTEGANNPLESATLYYSADGTDPGPNTGNSYVNLSAGSYSHGPVTVGTTTRTVKAYVSYTFAYNSGSTSPIAEKQILYHSLGSGGSIIVTDNGDNKFYISTTNPSAGTNNEITSSTLYYKIGSGAEQSVALSTTAKAFDTTGPYAITATSSITTRMVTTYKYAKDVKGTNSVTKTGTATTVTFHGDIGTPAVSVVSNNDNTFTITGTDAAGGTNNTATTAYAWGYSTAYGNSGTGTITIETTDTNKGTASFNVYAKATATSQYLNQTKTATAGPVTVKHYVAPSKPGVPTLTYTGNRLTNKVPWTFKWSAATETNSSSPIKGYTIKVDRKSKDTGKTTTEINTTTTSTSYTVSDPTAYNFVAGDTLTFTVSAFTRDKDGTGTKISSGTTSVTGTVANAGVVRINTSSGWKEGQVYVKVSSGWVEAESVSVKTADGWKESQ